MRHEPAWLRDYLIAGVEDPRLNLQSILARHFLLLALTGDAWASTMAAECRFSAAMNWLVSFVNRSAETEELAAVLHALRRKADNAEGIEIPQFMVQTFDELQTKPTTPEAPNYIESFLSGTTFADGKAHLYEPSLQTFQQLWSKALSDHQFAHSIPQLTVIEPACGSANDYRFLQAHGLARFLDYTGFDLCATNIDNARALFPQTRFEVGNVFEISAQDKAFDFCLVHDLFEHLSIPAMEVAVREVCRVTRRGLCVGFFQMDEIHEHIVRPMDDYHWNLLGAAPMKKLFVENGFQAQVIHIGAFLQRQFGCDHTHNENAYTFYLRASP